MTHIPVMPAEVLQYLRPERGGVFLDCTHKDADGRAFLQEVNHVFRTG